MMFPDSNNDGDGGRREKSIPAPLCLPASELPLGVCQLGLCLLVLAPQAYRTKEIQTNAEEDLKGNF